MSYIVWGRGGDAIHCMKGRRVPEVVNISPELRYEFGFIGGTISVSESRQFQKRSGRLYFIIERCIMHFISKLSLTNFMKIFLSESPRSSLSTLGFDMKSKGMQISEELVL